MMSLVIEICYCRDNYYLTKNTKMSNRAQHRCRPTTQVLLWLVAFKRYFIHKERELEVSLRLTMLNLPPIFLQSLQNTWICILMLKVTPTSVKWLNRARFARCQLAQKPRIKNPKTSNRSQRQYQPTTRVSLWSVALKRNFIHKERELVVSPYEAT